MTRDLLSFEDLTAGELTGLLARAGEHKAARAAGQPLRTLPGKVVAMVFEKASTRTRVSFEVGTWELGGVPVYLQTQGTQIGRGEPIEDLARVLDGYCHAIVIRTFGQDRIETLARTARSPVVNGLTDLLHPCQVVAGTAFVRIAQHLLHHAEGARRRLVAQRRAGIDVGEWEDVGTAGDELAELDQQRAVPSGMRGEQPGTMVVEQTAPRACRRPPDLGDGDDQEVLRTEPRQQPESRCDA